MSRLQQKGFKCPLECYINEIYIAYVIWFEEEEEEEEEEETKKKPIKL